MYKVESDFNYKGYRCVTTFSDLGHRCGYVGLPEGHPLYHVKYDDRINASLRDLERQSLGKRSLLTLMHYALTSSSEKDSLSADCFFNVHGGLTYSGGGKGSDYPVESDLWWFGFDCAHYCDKIDVDAMKQYWGDDASVQHRIEFEKEFSQFMPRNNVVRKLEYVQCECRSLVDQIIAYCTRYENGYFRKVIKLENYKKGV